MNDKNFERISIKIVIKHIAMHPCTKFQSIWRTSVFENRFAQKRLQCGVKGQTQPENTDVTQFILMEHILNCENTNKSQVKFP